MTDTIDELAELVRIGNFRQARKLARRLSGKAPARALWIIAHVGNIRETRPHAAAALIREFLDKAPTEEDRRIGYACMPDANEQRRSARRYVEPTPYRESPVTYERDADRVRAPRSARRQADEAAATRYAATRGGVADGDQLPTREDIAAAEHVYASGRDYDRDALVKRYTTELEFRCLACNMMRGRYDLDRDRMAAGHGDDGLCRNCREDGGTRGIPELPTGHTARDAVIARCEFVWTELGDAAGRVVLAREYREAKQGSVVRAAIAEFAAAHPRPQPVTELTACVSCQGDRTARDLRHVTDDDGMCGECRDTDALGDTRQPEPISA